MTEKINKPITPDEFRDRMIDIEYYCHGDIEIMHARMDELMCDVLEDLGYGEGVDVFLNTDKWYA